MWQHDQSSPAPPRPHPSWQWQRSPAAHTPHHPNVGGPHNQAVRRSPFVFQRVCSSICDAAVEGWLKHWADHMALCAAVVLLLAWPCFAISFRTSEKLGPGDCDLCYPASACYNDTIAVDNPLCGRLPLVVLWARSVQGVVNAVNWAAQHDYHLSVRSGGHSAGCFCLNEDGVVLDMRHLKVRIKRMADFSVVSVTPLLRLCRGTRVAWC
jgi:hypothetical protein